ncbi:hypothetical protein ACQUWQ_24465, partial [Ralstonia pseudosolanacearum]|uniref:hypothetical protein n=1 Tax=Ralstonia pseudosolanacearum TaxID=1310165 RepID=UPI003D185C2D
TFEISLIYKILQIYPGLEKKIPKYPRGPKSPKYPWISKFFKLPRKFKNTKILCDKITKELFPFEKLRKYPCRTELRKYPWVVEGKKTITMKTTTFL